MGRRHRRGDRAAVRVDRLSANDLTTLVTDRGPVPMHIAAALVVEPPTGGGPGVDAATVARLLDERVAGVPRLRQRLHGDAAGLARPYWSDDEQFDVRRHLEVHAVDGFAGLLELAADVVCRPLPRDRPLWAAHWVTGVGPGRNALVIVAHHVLADGIGGVAVLQSLADPAVATPSTAATPASASTNPLPSASTSVPTSVPTGAAGGGTGSETGAGRRAPWPSRHDLTAASRMRRTAMRGLVGRLARRIRVTASGLRDLGVGARPPRLVARTSLNRPTGPTRRIGVVDRPLDLVLSAAHRLGATVNDLVLVAVAGALVDVLEGRGEGADEIVVSVPYSARPSTTARDLGNASGVVPFRVPGTGADARARLERVHAQSLAQRNRPRAASAAPLGLVFRFLARVGLFRWFIERQRLVTTFVTNVRGPAQSVRLGGCEVSRIIPVAVTPGNTTATFDVLSYAGRLGVTVVADPVTAPDAPHLVARVGARLDELLG